MADATTFTPGEPVRVQRDCPLTLPHYARTLDGVVVQTFDDGHALVRFGEEHEFPVPIEYLERVGA